MIQLISNRIDVIVRRQTELFTSHKIIELLMTQYRNEWDRFVGSYNGNQHLQEQKAVQQVGCYLGRNVTRLHLTNNGTTASQIATLCNHDSRQTTKYIPNFINNN